MKIVIDAWLERSEPTLRVLDCEKHEVLLERSGAYLRNLLDEGLLELDNLGESVWFLLQQSAPEKKFAHQ